MCSVFEAKIKVWKKDRSEDDGEEVAREHAPLGARGLLCKPIAVPEHEILRGGEN